MLDWENFDDKFINEKLNFEINENIDDNIIDMVSLFFAYESEPDSFEENINFN